AFDDALNSHSRKPVDGVEARKWNKHAAQGVAAQPHTHTAEGRPQQQPSTPSSTTSRGVAAAAAAVSGGTSPAGAGYQHPRSVPSGRRDQGFQEADRRFASLLAKGNAEASSGGGTAGVVRAGIPGPWEPVAGPTEGQQYGRTAGHQDDPGQRTEYGRPGAYDPNARQEEYGGGAHNYSYSSRAAPHHPQPPHPPGGAAGGFEEGGRGLPLPPPPPPPPHPGVGPHTAAFQVTSRPAILAFLH
ncbi:unnamed protein product, partial [Ectocarpus fasciculatus]